MSYSRKWLESMGVTDDPEGDLVADMLRDPDLPPLFLSMKMMRNYILDHGGCREAVEAVPGVWQRYKKRLNKLRATEKTGYRS